MSGIIGQSRSASFDFTISTEEANAVCIALRADAKSHMGSPLSRHQLRVADALHDALAQLGLRAPRVLS